MLPFLKLKHEGSASSPVEHQTREPDDGSDYDSLESAAQDLISAVHSKNVKAVCEALRAAFELCDLGPQSSDEGE
jgi:hypothetical protein